MPENVPEVGLSVWLGPLKDGDPEAARRVWEAAFPKLVALARNRLRTTSRAAADEDLALSAFASFCRGAEQGRFPRLDDRDDLWQILLMLVHRKAVEAARRETRAKRGGGQVVQASAVACGDADPLASLRAGDPTPEAAARVAEECDRLLKMLDDATLRDVAVWKMEGYTNAEIAKKIGRVEGTVERKLALIRQAWAGEVPQ